MQKFIAVWLLICISGCIKKQPIITLKPEQILLNQSETIQDLKLKPVIFEKECPQLSKVIYCIDEMNLLNLINNIKTTRIAYNEVRQKLQINDKYYDNSK